MAQNVKKTAILNGTPSISAVGVNAYESLGNVGKLTVTANFEEKSVPNHEGGGGDNDAFSKFKDGNVSLDCRQVSIALFEIALGGPAAAVTAGAVADEPHTVVALDKLIALDHMQDMAVVITVEPVGGGAAFVEGTDYLRKRAGIIPITGGAIAADDNLLVSYTKHKHQRVQALINTVTEKGLLFDGRNERSGAPWLGKFHRIAFGPTKTLEFIGDDFLNWTIEGKILAYDGITDPAKSQFYEVLVGDL